MKSCLALLVLAALVLAAQGAAAPSIKDKVAAGVKKCVGETKIPADKGKLAFNQDIPKAENEKCFLECVYKTVGVIQGDKFSLEGSKKLVQGRFSKPEEINLATKLVETCNKEVTPKSGEKCSLGRVVRECFVKHGKAVNFFPSAA